MEKINVIKEIKELKTQLAYSKNIGFFWGAGTSCALNIPNIQQLTEMINEQLVEELLEKFNCIKKDLETIYSERRVNIEDVLTQVRRIREITGEKEDKEYIGINGEQAKKLDNEICKLIYKIITEKEQVANINSTKRFFAWLSMLNRNVTKEIFTTNYDLIIEKALEANEIPYFDGFVGSYEPFFWQESIDKTVSSNDLTQNWIRLWKIHGSLSWFWKENKKLNTQKIIRVGNISNICDGDNEIVIYPSKEKYSLSKKQPFVAYFDRLKNYLLGGELLFLFSGYSFSDQHINEIIFNCLRQNNRLTVIVFFFLDEEVENLYKQTSTYLNMNVFGPTKAIINGKLGEWTFGEESFNSQKHSIFWDNEQKKLKLGDFNELVNFIVGKSEQDEDEKMVTQ